MFMELIMMRDVYIVSIGLDWGRNEGKGAGASHENTTQQKSPSLSLFY